MSEICILHDQFRELGGAERVACEMARALGAPIFAARVDDGVAPSDVEVCEIFDGWPGRLMRSHYMLQDIAQMVNWQHRPEIYEFGTVIVNKTNPLWYVPRDDQTVIGYLHTPPRGFYDQFYRQGAGVTQAVIKTAMKALFETNRIQPDAWACNSDLVERRAELYWNRTERIRTIYPPVPVHQFSASIADTADYYLAFGRLHGHKRFADVVEAFKGSDERLVIGGDGPQRDELETIAAGYDNIEVRGWLSESEKHRRLSEAQALIVPHEREDFGMTAIEAFASGTPVVGVEEGFTEHQVVDGQNGYLYDRDGNGRDLMDAVDRLARDGVEWSATDLERFADRFGVERFHTAITEWVAEVENRTEVAAPWETAERPPEPIESEPALTDGGNE